MIHRFARRRAAIPLVVMAVVGSIPVQATNDSFVRVPTIAFSTTVPDTPGSPTGEQFSSDEIYLLDPAGGSPPRLTDNPAAEAVATTPASDTSLSVGDIALARRAARCVHRLAIGHVPGHLHRVWVLRCVPPRPVINRH
jgi:hypothetical protein